MLSGGSSRTTPTEPTCCYASFTLFFGGLHTDSICVWHAPGAAKPPFLFLADCWLDVWFYPPCRFQRWQ